jgi:hypothetical protein
LFTSIDFSKAVTSAIIQIQTVQRALQEITCPEIEALTINLNDLSEERICALLKAVPTGSGKSGEKPDYIYVIQVQDDRAELVSTLRAQFYEARKISKDYARLNSENKDTKILYVGRSKALRSRIKQHLGAEGRGIYSLHLQRWATGNNAEITISIMKFNGVDNLLVQAIEDGLWASLKPAFGRKGER